MFAFSDWYPCSLSHRCAFGNRHPRHTHPDLEDLPVRGAETLPHGPVLPRIRAERARRHLEELRRRRGDEHQARRA